MRLLIPIIFGFLFIVWLVYRLYKRDLNRHWSEMGFGVFFIGAWALIYWLVLN